MRLALDRFRRWFWRPPRAHGEIDPERSVSFLELFYDLVYVVVIAQAARRLATDISLRSAIEFAVVFGLIWLAWINGTLYYELHGREDGRTRSFVFVQMAILALLAVFTPGAAGVDGTAFAVVYAAFLVVLTWLWYTVRRRDRPEFMEVDRPLPGGDDRVAGRHRRERIPLDGRTARGLGRAGPRLDRLLGGARAAVPTTLGRRHATDRVDDRALRSAHDHRPRRGRHRRRGRPVVGAEGPIDAGDRVCAPCSSGFGLWWVFFDFVGRRLPVDDGFMLNLWMVSHLPVTLAIAAAGASMVALIEHASDARAPADVAWLLGGSVAVGLVALVVTARTLEDWDRLGVVYRPLARVMVGASIAALVVAWLQPAPWLLAFGLVAILSAVWLFAVDRVLRLEAGHTD